MTKQQAIKAIQHGKKVKHQAFFEGEFIYINNHMIVNSEGFASSQFEFWEMRTANWWNTGWEIVEKKKK